MPGLDSFRTPMAQNVPIKIPYQFTSRHNNTASWYNSSDKYSVTVYSSDHITAPESSSDTIDKQEARMRYTENGPYQRRFGYNQPYKSRTASDAGSSIESELIVNRKDHFASINDCPTSYTNSTARENIYYNADPFGYASSDWSKNMNHRRFEEHEEAMRTTMPSTANANRVDLIDTVRRKSRETMQAIVSGSNDSNIIWVSAQVAGAGIHHATHTAGVVGMGGALLAGNVAVAATAAPLVVATMGATRLIQRLARDVRLSRALRDRQEIKNQLSTTLPQARADRDVYLESVDDALKNSTKEGVVMVWDTIDRHLPRHMDKLASIGPGSDSVPKKFGSSGASTTSHELKYSVLAETRLLNQVKTEVRSYAISNLAASAGVCSIM